ncbi:MAG: radical SAM protein [Promethearchaeati archaeon SRVP18_Atabeyarchaeia-1]
MSKEVCRVAIVDALGSGSEVRYSSKDAIGCGPRRIAGVLESKGLAVRVFLAEDLISKPSLADDSDLLMVSAMSLDKDAAHRIVSAWRKRHGGKPAIIGGPIASEPEDLLASGYDVVVSGEGENSLLALLQSGLGNGSLPMKFRQTIISNGVAHKAGIESHTRPLFSEYSQKSYADEHELLDKYCSSTNCVKDYPAYRALKFYVEVVRGCSNFLRTSIPLPSGRKCLECGKCREGKLEDRIQCPVDIPPGCGFCAVPSLYGYPRSRDRGKIAEEVTELVRAGIRRIVLSASDFLDYQREKLVATGPLTDPRYPHPNTSEIDGLLSRLSSIQQKLNISEKDYVYISVENIKPCLFNDEVASIIAEYLPGSTIHLGCETGSEEHSAKLGRPSTPSQTLAAAKTASRHGLRPYVYFIHGLPGQTAETARETVDLMREMVNANVEKLTIYKFKPLPLSAFAEFPPAPPAKRDKNSRKIEKAARKLNVASKFRLLGKTLDVVASGSVREARRKGTIAYPVSEGPVVLLPNKFNREGERLKVKITGVLSDRLVEGEAP